MLRFRPRNQHILRHAELAAKELLLSGDELRGLSVQALVQIAAIVQPLDLMQLLLGMRVQINALAVKRMREQQFGREPRNGNGAILQDFHPLE